jgi:capsid assembly protein Gp20
MPTPSQKPFEDEIIDVKKQSLYARLKRLFSTDVIVRNVGGKQIKVKDTDNVMFATDRNSLRDRFNRIRSTAYNAYTRDFSLSYQAARMDLFRDYDTMDMDPIIASALDIYADECLTYNEMGKMLTVHSTNNNVKMILENLFDDVLNIRFNLWSWVRNMTKYGDFYLKLYITPEYGVYMVEPISAYNVERIENSDPYNKRYVKFQIRPTDTAQAEVLENYEMAHFRLLSDSNFLPYGKGMIEGARRVWKQLSLMEDAMLIHRIMRAPEKRIFYTDIGNIPPAEVDNYMQKMMDKMKKVPYMDEQTGEYNLRFNLQNMVEDYYIPVRGGDSGTKIDTLGGMEWTGTEDIEYLRNKMMAALKIPKAFLGYEEGISGKATLASEDVRFARTIQRLQRIICSELSKIAIVHLYSQGYRDESLVDFELELTNPSTIFEKEQLEIWQDKVDVAANMIEQKLFSMDWIYKNIFHMSEDDIKQVREEVVEDAKQRYRFNAIEEDGDDPARPFKKINPSGGGGDEEGGEGEEGGKGGPKGGGGGDLGDLGDLDDLAKGGKGGKGGDDLDLDALSAGEDDGGSPDDLVKETKVVDDRDRSDRDQSDRDQSGQHSATSHPFGEDPIGRLERSAQPRKHSEGKPVSAITHNFDKNSPLRLQETKAVSTKKGMDSDVIRNLAEFLKKSKGDTQLELISENQTTGSKSSHKSFMDESRILE